MDEEYQRMAANSIAHEAFCAGQAWQHAAAAQERPCVLWKPSLFRDGNQWCALLGENIQEGVVGFGDSPDAAMWAFDEAWREKLPPAPGAQPAPNVPECPYPCGWQNLLKHAIVDGSYLARSINEDEPVTENARAVTMRTVLRLRDVLMAINNAAPEER